MQFPKDNEQITFSVTEDKTFCDYGVLDFEIDGDGAVVCAISVYKKRLGIGTKLVQLFEELAAKENVKFIEVPVSPNKEAILFWKSLKYEPSTDDDMYWVRKITRSKREDSWETIQGVVVMTKILPANEN